MNVGANRWSPNPRCDVLMASFGILQGCAVLIVEEKDEHKGAMALMLLDARASCTEEREPLSKGMLVVSRQSVINLGSALGCCLGENCDETRGGWY